jgi:hypothetical protein
VVASLGLGLVVGLVTTRRIATSLLYGRFATFLAVLTWLLWLMVFASGDRR